MQHRHGYIKHGNDTNTYYSRLHTNKETGAVTETNYYLVKDLIKQFRGDHPDWSISTNLEKMEGGNVVFKAVIMDEKREERFTGWAWENTNHGYINKHSALENCETSAIGRALRNMGYGDGVTAEEMAKPIDDSMKDQLIEMLRTSTFDDEQKVHYEQQINNCTLAGFDELVGLMLESQLDPIKERGTGSQKDINKQLTLIDKDPKK